MLHAAPLSVCHRDRVSTRRLVRDSPSPGLEVRRFCHGERRRKARKKVAVILAIGHTFRAHEALGGPDALSGFLEVVRRLFEDGVFIGHDQSMRTGGIFRSPDCYTFSREHPG